MTSLLNMARDVTSLANGGLYVKVRVKGLLSKLFRSYMVSFISPIKLVLSIQYRWCCRWSMFIAFILFCDLAMVFINAPFIPNICTLLVCDPSCTSTTTATLFIGSKTMCAGFVSLLVISKTLSLFDSDLH